MSRDEKRPLRRAITYQDGSMSRDRELPLPPEFQEQINQVQAIGCIAPFLALLSRFGVGGDRLKNFVADFRELKAQAAELAELPVAFHEGFAERGWLISESTSLETARAALSGLECCSINDAEDLLASDYEGDRLDFVVKRLCQTQGFKLRKAQLQEALTLTHEGRYLAAAPLLLIVADGVGEDEFKKSIFSDGVDLEELHSLAGQPDALPRLVKQMCRTRRKTTEETVSFPYRNGILHGRDLGYGNRLITAKCWSFLSNIADVIRAREAKRSLNPEPEPSISDLLDRHANTLDQRERITAWRARPISRDRINVFAEPTTYDLVSDEPETALADFLRAWKGNNFGRMGALTVYFDNRPVNRRAGEIRKMINGVTLIGAVIICIEDKMPAITEITVDLSYSVESGNRSDRFTFVMNCVDDDGELAVHGDKAAHWLVLPSYQGWATQHRT